MSYEEPLSRSKSDLCKGSDRLWKRYADGREAAVLPLPDEASPEYLWHLATDPLGLDPFLGMAIVLHPNVNDLTIRYLTRSASGPDGMSLAKWRATQVQTRKTGER